MSPCSGCEIANTAPILVLGAALLYGYPKAARITLPIIYLGSGLAVWLFARHSWHLGASGLAFGLMFFIFTMGVVRWERRAIALSLAVFLLYGGMIWGLFPTDPHISFEYHLESAKNWGLASNGGDRGPGAGTVDTSLGMSPQGHR